MRKKLRQPFTYETLESKCLLAADIYISEFMAINNTGIVDEDGDDSDWIELYNAGPDDVQLSNYFLTDDADRLAKWELPATTLGAGNHLLIYASGKDRTDPGQPIHANFKLSGSGEYLALTQRDTDDQDSVIVVSEFSPEFGQQFGDISYGVGQDVEITPLVENSAVAKVFYPTDDSLGDSWMTTDFDDSTWDDGSLSVGYQRTQPGLLVEDVKAAGRINNLTEALAVLDGDGQTSRSVAVSPTINFRDPEGGGGEEDIFEGDSPFPNNTDADDNDFVIRATGTITFPSPGIWGIGAVHDDGISIKIDGVTVHENDSLRPGGLGFGLVDLEAGDHSIEVVYFERSGPAELELLAGQEGPSLVGDVANGGLAIKTGSTVRGLAELITADSLDSMYEQVSSVYVRNSFAVDANALPETLTLSMQYDGGFVAYLNGTEIARRNVADGVEFDSLSVTSRADHLITRTEAIDVTEYLSLLKDGENVLAIHGLNDAIDSDEFLVTASLAEISVATNSNYFFKEPSPGEFNPEFGVDGFLTHEITFSKQHGFYDEAFEVEISANTEGTSIRYTLDGSEPTADTGFAYTDPVTIDSTTTLRARAFEGERDPSYTETATYVFLSDVLQQSSDGSTPENFPTSRNINGQTLDYGMDPDIVEDETWGPQLIDALTQVPSMSLVLDVDDLLGSSEGIYTNANSHGRAWERPASLELIYPDGTEGFQINAGVRLRGGFSRIGSNPKHAFRMFFRDDYGDGSLEFPLFGDESVSEFEKIDLRTTQNYSWAFGGDSRNIFLRDIFARDAQGEMDQPYTRSEYYHLYLNGQYWGLFQTQERAEANYGASYFGGDADDYDVVKSAGSSGAYVNEATDGDLEAYRRLANFFYQDGGLSDANMDSYWQAQGMNPDGTRNSSYERLLDVENLAAYAALLYYTGDRDGPVSRFVPERVNNYYGVYNREQPDGFKFFEHDSEHSLDTGDTSLVTPLTSSGADFAFFNPQWMHEQLMATNSEYQLLFADLVYEHFFDGGILTPESSQDRLNSRAVEIDQAIIAESARWGDAMRGTPYDKDDWLNAVETTHDWFEDRTDVVLKQFRDQGWLEVTPPPVFRVDGVATRTDNVYDDSEVRAFSGELVNRTDILAAGSIWKYLDDGSDLGTSWRGVEFDDAAWSEGAGQLGYGDGDEQTLISVREDDDTHPVTMYFRTEVEVNQDFDELIVRLVRDDGAVVYINGVEVVRDNMPDGEIAFDTTATRAQRRVVENDYIEHIIDPRSLKQGVNTIAVEVHQDRLRAGGDMSFDLQLVGGISDFSEGALYYTTDGSDPRLPGGAPNPNAIEYDGTLVPIDDSVDLRARTLVDGRWSGLTITELSRVDGLRGDMNGDGIVDVSDIDAVASAIRTGSEENAFDLNRDDVVDQLDMDYLVESVLNTKRGDTNLDGQVDFIDFLALATNFGEEEKRWSDGNFGADVAVDFKDFLDLAENFGFGQ